MQPLADYSRFIWNKTGLIVSILALVILSLWTLGPTREQTVDTLKGSVDTIKGHVDTLKGLAPSVPESLVPTPLPKKHWPGWAGIKHMIVFGDSYTATGFKIRGQQPDEMNPLGNPEWPGQTSSNGPNWVDFLTTHYNQTFLRTLNFAEGGATVDGDLIRQFVPAIHSFKTQVEKDYLPNYCPPPSSFDWKADDTLFASFFGINDVNNAWQHSNTEVLDQDICEYADLIDKVYQSGARNFLFMKVPAFERSPLVVGHGDKAVNEEGQLINEFNANITRMAANLSSTYHDVSTFVFDTYRIYNQVMDDPCSHDESCSLKNTTEFCALYGEDTTDWYAFDEGCSISVDQYFWFNPLHPTFRIQNVTAKEVAKQLSSDNVHTPGTHSSMAAYPSANPYR